jgi:Ca2+-binding RTX toxin-like protein
MSRSSIETLETRVLFAAHSAGTAVLEAGTLLVAGTRRADDIHLSLNAGDATRLDVVINGGTPVTFDLAELTAGIRIEGGNGGDTLGVDPAVSIGAVLIGGNGKDVLSGGAGDDRLEGGNGIDHLTGGAGRDALLGGNGADVLNGGDDDDHLDGGRAKDRVTGGPGTDVFNGDVASEILDEAADESITGNRRGPRRP